MQIPNQPFIIGFNGPPRSGKDTLGTALADKLCQIVDIPVFTLSLAQPMREAVMSLCSIATREEYDEVKDLPAKLLAKSELSQDGINTFENYGTVREFMIRLSEDFVKPTYGRDFWARCLVDQHRSWWGKSPAVVIITDIGFEEEVTALQTLVGFGNYLGIQLDRQETSWKLDSRGYVDSVNVRRVTNDATPEFAAERILYCIHNDPMNWNLK